MPFSIVIPNPQNVCKDTYAPAPKLDLTARANGEEAVQIMDCLGNWYRAGFEAPTAPIVVTPDAAAAPAFPASKFFGYKYVYVAKRAFPLVENAVTGGGSPAPRSNPSPSVVASTDATPNIQNLAIPTTQATAITHIWIYRTGYFNTTEEAQTNIDGNVAFWIGEVENNLNLATVPFQDNGTQTGLEQIEGDNYLSPQFKYVIFADPFFYGIGNDELTVEVTVDAVGLMTIVDPSAAKWFDGRNGQVVQMDGITGGGFDNLGGFYFKYLTADTAQLYLDIALTLPASVNPIGTTMATIKGPSTTLYRSKIRNPFSWGFTDLIGTAQAPQPYAFVVGGGRATALYVLPNLNLLKIDTEGPNKCYTLNLKNAGTPNFEPSLRPMPDNYTASLHHTQFTAAVAKGPNVSWALDTKTFAIIECDGSSQQAVSDAVFETLRGLSLEDADRVHFHGNYCPRHELNCLFVRTAGVEFGVNRCIYMHGPTNQWGMIDVFDVMCSAQVLDRYTKEMKLIVGTSTGMIGEFGAKDTYAYWCPAGLEGPPEFPGGGEFRLRANPTGGFGPVLNLDGVEGLIGNWMSFIDTVSAINVVDTTQIITSNLTYGRIETIEKLTDGGGDYWKFTFDQFLNRFGQAGSFPTGAKWAFIGLIPAYIQKVFDADLPFEVKRVEEILMNTTDGVGVTPFFKPTFAFARSYNFAQAERYLMGKTLATPTDYTVPIFATGANFSIEQSSKLGIMLTLREYMERTIFGFELRLSIQDGNRR